MVHPLTNLLLKDTPFVFNDSCVKPFEKLQFLLISAIIVQALAFSLPFEIMYEAFDYAIRVILSKDESNVSCYILC